MLSAVALFPALLSAQVSFVLSDFTPEDLTMGVQGQQIEIVMSVLSISDSLDLVRILAPESDTLSTNPADYSASGGNPSGWTIVPTSDSVRYLPNEEILPGDVVAFRVGLANVAPDSMDVSQIWGFGARDHDQLLWGSDTRVTTDRALEMIDLRFVPAGADDGSASAGQALDTVLVKITNHGTDSIAIEALDSRLFGDAFSTTGTEGAMPSLSPAASDTADLHYAGPVVTSVLGYRTASATAGNASIPALRTGSEQLFIQEPGTLSVVSVSTAPTTVSRGQSGILVGMTVANVGEDGVVVDSSSLRFLEGGTGRDSDYDVALLAGPDTILGGQSRTFQFSVDVHGDAGTGTIELNGRVWGRDLNSGSATSDTTATNPDSFTVQLQATLEVSEIEASQDTVSRGQENVSVLMVITNTGEASAVPVSANLRFVSGGVNVDGDYSTILITPLDTLAGSDTDTLEYLVDVGLSATLDSIIIHGRIFGRDVNSGEDTADTTAIQPGAWVVQGAAELVCSLWADPETVIVGQDIDVEMRVWNTGGAYCDSVVPQLSVFGGGSVSLGSGPSPSYADIPDGGSVTFSWVYTAQDTHWVYFRGYGSGRDHNSGVAVISPEDTSNGVLLQTAPSPIFVAGTVEPDSVTQRQVTGYQFEVFNEGEAWIEFLSDSTSFRYTDGTDTVYVMLLNPVTVSGGDTGTLEFEVARVPASMDAGAYRSRSTVVGRSMGGYSYQNSLLCDTVEVILRPVLADQPNSLDPATVSQGQTASFSVDVINQGGLDLVLTTATTARFTDGVRTFLTTLEARDTVDVGETETLEFSPGLIPSQIVDSSYSLTLELRGFDSINPNFVDTLVTVDEVAVQIPADLLVDGVMTPRDTVIWGETGIGVKVAISNAGAATAAVDSASVRFIHEHQNVDSWYSTNLTSALDPLPGGSSDTLVFVVDVDSQAGAGVCTLHARVYGRDVNSSMMVSDTTAGSPDQWTVQGPAELSCSLWVEPDTAIISQNLYLYMRARNTGGTYADSVVPRLTAMGDGTAGLVSGPTPDYADVAAEDSVTFSWVYSADATHWVYWRGYSRGTDHISGEILVAPEDTSNQVLIQTPPSLVSVPGSLEPDSVTSGQRTGYTLQLHNDGEAWVEIRPDSTFFRYTDGTDTVEVPLIQTFTVGGGATETVEFDAARIPGDMNPGIYRSRAAVVGKARGAYPYVTSILCDSISVIEGPDLIDVSSTVDPDTVSQGQTASFSIVVRNRGMLDVILRPATELRFTDGIHSFVGYLAQEDTIDVDEEERLDFGSQQIDPGMADSTYDLTLIFDGYDIINPSYADTVVTTGRNDLLIQTPALFRVLQTIAAPDTVGRSEEDIPVQMVVRNNGQAHGHVDSLGLNFFQGADTLNDEYRVVPVTSLSMLFGLTTDTVRFLVDVDSLATYDVVSVDGWIYGRDVNSSRIIFDTDASSPDSWYVQGPAELAATVAVSPDTVIVTQPISLSLRVDNIGGAITEGVEPFAILWGEARDSIQPTPPWPDINPGSNSVFDWVWVAEDTPTVSFEVYAVGVDHNTDSTVFSDTATSDAVIVQSPPQVSFVGNSLEPDTFTVNQTVHCSLMVDNSGEAWLRVLRSTTLSFNDTDGDTVSATLSGITFVGGVSESTLLIFDPMTVPASMEPGDWQARLDLQGEARNGYTYTSEDLPLQWVSVQDSAALVDEANTLVPEHVTQGQDSVEISVQIRNFGDVDIDLNINSNISFNDGAVSYQSFLAEPATIEAAAGSLLRFEPAAVHPQMTPQSYLLDLHFEGTDTNGKHYTIQFQSNATNSVTVQTPPELSYVQNSIEPVQVTRGQQVAFQVAVENTGQADLILPQGETVLRFQDLGGHQFQAVLAETVVVSGETKEVGGSEGKIVRRGFEVVGSKGTSILSFAAAGVDSSFLPGRYRPAIEISGMDSNTEGYQITLSTDSIRVLSPPLLTAGIDLPARVNQGQTFQVTMTVTNTGGATALGVRPSPDRLQIQGTASATYQNGPNPASYDLPPGSTESFAWEFGAGVTTGWLNFRGYVFGQDSISGDPVRSDTSISPDMVVQIPAALSASFADLPSDYYVGYEFQVVLLVENTGEAEADSVHPSPPSPSSPGFVALLEEPSLQYVTLGGGELHQFAWRYRIISGEGQWIYFTGAASGRDLNSGDPLLVGATSDSMYIRAATAREIRITPDSRAPISCAMGQRDLFMLDLDLINVGDSLVHTAEVREITVRIEDEETSGIIPTSAIASLSVYDYAEDTVIGTASAPDTGDYVIVDIDDGFYLQAGQPSQLAIVVEVAGSASANSFRVSLRDSLSVDAVDSVWAAVDSIVPIRILDRVGEPLSNMRSDYTAILASDLESSFCNYPNPFSPPDEVTHITYNLESESRVTMKIFTLLGDLVWLREFGAGTAESTSGLHEVEWDGRNEGGEIVRNGVYICKIETDAGDAMTKIAVTK